MTKISNNKPAPAKGSSEPAVSAAPAVHALHRGGRRRRGALRMLARTRRALIGGMILGGRHSKMRRFNASTGERFKMLRARTAASLRPLRTTVAILRAQQEATLDGILVVSNERTILTYNRRFLEIWDIPEVVARRGKENELLEVALERVADLDQFVREVDAVYANPREVRHGDEVKLRNGRTLSRASVPVVSDTGEITGRAWYFRDITEHKKGVLLQSALFRISEVARSAPDLDQLYVALHQIVGELMDATNFYIAVYDETQAGIVFPYFVDQFDLLPPVSAPLGKSLTNYVLATGRALLATPEIFQQMLASGEVESIGEPSVDWLGVPLKVGDVTFGVLGVQSYSENVRYGEKEKDILVFVSQHVASAIEHKRKEDAVRESELRYRQMFENNQAVKLLIDPETGEIIDGNPAACEFYGYTHEELIARKVWDINTQSPDSIRKEMNMATAGKRAHFDFRHRLASGEIRNVEVHSGTIHQQGRRMLYSIVHDVTERKRAEQGLLRSEEKYRNIFDFASVGIYQSTPDGTIITANKTLARMLGYNSVEDLQAKNMALDVYYDEIHRDALIVRFSLQPIVGDVEILWKKRDGTPVWVQLNAHTIRDETGAIAYYEGFVHDITARKHAEETMRNQSAAMAASMDGMAIINADGAFVYMNDAHARLYGYRAAEDMLGVQWRSVFDESEEKRFDQEISPIFADQSRWRGETIGRRRDGSTFPQEISIAALQNGNVVSVVRDITERTYAEEQIRHLAYHDALTGLPNRLLLKDRLTVALNRAEREASSLGILFLDLDHFKYINDSLGHNVGDQLLQAVALRLQSCVRESDTVARLGGDEFTILVPAIKSSEDAGPIARKILETVRLPFFIDGRDFYITTSIGVSVYPEDGSDAESLIKNADTAMYQAKEQGRNNHQLFNAQINAQALDRLSLENGLRRAVANEELILHYQPIYNIATRRIYGMEALVRWQHPERGMILPAQFIPLAEASDLMPSIGSWVLRTACRQLRVWEQHGFTGLTLALNLSATQLVKADLVEEIIQTIASTGVDPCSVELEITESSAMQNPEASIHALQQLKEYGVRISLDDFGTGHSSLSYLKRFPIDTLKIDQSFVRDLSTDAETAAIVIAIIAMAYSLKLKVIAEGVEQEDQRWFLASHGCEYMQGFLFERGIPADAFELLLETERAAGKAGAI